MHAGAGLLLAGAATAVRSPCGPQGRDAIHLVDRARPRSDQGWGR